MDFLRHLHISEFDCLFYSLKEPKTITGDARLLFGKQTSPWIVIFLYNENQLINYKRYW